MRGSVERMYPVWKVSSGSERHCCRGLAKVRTRVLLTVLMRPAMGLLDLMRSEARCPAADGDAPEMAMAAQLSAPAALRVGLALAACGVDESYPAESGRRLFAF